METIKRFIFARWAGRNLCHDGFIINQPGFCEHSMKRISLKGVTIGSIVDIVSTEVILLPVMIYFVVSSGLPPDRLAGSASEIPRASTPFLVCSTILGSLCSVLGGYIAARIAKHDEVLNGALSSILCVGSGVYALLSGGASGHIWLHLVYLPLSPALGALGGFLRARQIARRA
jgi:hypothetical protein